MATRHYDHVPTLDLNSRRFIVAKLTPRAATLGLQLGDVIEVGDRDTVVYRCHGYGPARKLVDSLVVSGTLSRLEMASPEASE